MKAVGYKTPQSITEAGALQDIVLPDPLPTGRDLLVDVRAVSVNPVDTKVRASAGPPSSTPKCRFRIFGEAASM